VAASRVQNYDGEILSCGRVAVGPSAQVAAKSYTFLASTAGISL